MSTLLLRLCAPMQSWGTQSNFSHRDTGREPSKSALIGLLCAALGRSRGESVADLNALRMGVRVDQDGVVRRDFHTAGVDGYYKVSGGIGRKNPIISNRYYLADAKFLVGLEGERPLLDELQAALQRPRWFLFLGRKAFIPAERVWMRRGLQETDLETALTNFPWLGQGERPERLRLVLEDRTGSIVRNDRVLSFEDRRFLPRKLTQHFIPTPDRDFTLDFELSNENSEDHA